MDKRPRIIDITPPKARHAASPAPVAYDRIAPPAPRPLPRVHARKPLVRYAATLGAVLLVSAGTIYGAGVLTLAWHARESGTVIVDEFKNAARALRDFDPVAARTSLENASREIRSIETRSDALGLTALLETGGEIIESLKTIPATVSRAGGLTKRSIALALELERLKTGGFALIVGGRGKELLARLASIRDILARISELSGALERGAPSAIANLSENVFPLRLNIARANAIIGALARYLTEEPRRFAILFQNESEIRPGGGFIGSYADLAIQNASLQSLKVWDIYDPDGQLEERIVPPEPLQGITPRWGARDANWFFDFPTSAAKVLAFLDASKIYAEQSVRFDGALAVNSAVVKSLLAAVGPIPLPEYDLVITPENFLPEIQREVEAGQDKAAGEPKRILKLITPILFERLGDLSDEAKHELVQAFRDHFAQRDLMLFMRDPELQSYTRDAGIAGDVLETPNDFRGDYLAVVHANVAAGKTDAVINQRISVESVIEPDGRVENRVAVERRHRGDRETDPWYRVPNRSYVKIFTPRGSKLTLLTGNERRTISPLVDYAGSGYAVDDTLAVVETSRKALPEFNAHQLTESGKTVFAGWMHTEAGASQTMTAQYYTPQKLPIWNGAEIPYTFIFEKQSGARTNFSLTLSAPEGYVWQNNPSGPIFSYASDDPPGRLMLDLMLVPVPSVPPGQSN